MGDCSVCLVSVHVSPFGESVFGPPAPVVSFCGHVFHRYCWSKSWTLRTNWCPKCKSTRLVDDYFLMFPEEDSAVSDLQSEVAAMKQELNTLKKEKASLESENKKLLCLNSALSRRRDENAGVKSATETVLKCVNCYSPSLKAEDCSRAPFLRLFQPMTVGIGQGRECEYIVKISDVKAGEVISKYQRKLRQQFNKEEVQVLFGLIYWEEACWNCRSPSHHRPDCVKDPAPGLRKLAKKLYVLLQKEKIQVQANNVT